MGVGNKTDPIDYQGQPASLFGGEISKQDYYVSKEADLMPQEYKLLTCRMLIYIFFQMLKGIGKINRLLAKFLIWN